MSKKSMRDVLIAEIHKRMEREKLIFFLSADLGAPALDRLRDSFPDRCINVGIAEQNLINVATGLALEGYTVYGYGIAAFIVMRCYEQIRTNLSLLAQTRKLNVNLIGVGSGLSYNLSGPTHHCLEDLALTRLFPNFMVFSPSDWTALGSLTDLTLKHAMPKYIRLDGQPVDSIYAENTAFDWEDGVCEIRRGEELCLIATGIMTHKALDVAQQLKEKNRSIGVVDVGRLKPVAADKIGGILSQYKRVATMEEGFTGSGGLDSMIEKILTDRGLKTELTRIGFNDKHVFDLGSRNKLHALYGMDEQGVAERLIRETL